MPRRACSIRKSISRTCHNPGVHALNEESHRLQARSILRRWRARLALQRVPAPTVPERPAWPEAAERHYRQLSWVVHEQRLFALTLAALGSACGLVWMAAWGLRTKPAVVLRAKPTLKEAAAAYYGIPDISYDQVVFFLHACLPLLYEGDENGHAWLPLAEGLVAPEVYDAAERRLAASDGPRRVHLMRQALTIARVGHFVADSRAGRAAAEVEGELTVAPADAPAKSFPWSGRVILAVNPGSRLDPYPFYLLALDTASGPGSQEGAP